MNITLVGIVAGSFTSLASIPQAVKTWRSKHTADLAIGQPVMLATGSALWLYYSTLIDDLPLQMANITPLICNLFLIYMKFRFKD